jgi:uncharacterized membrane protein YoaT (DUF817 family)
VSEAAAAVPTALPTGPMPMSMAAEPPSRPVRWMGLGETFRLLVHFGVEEALSCLFPVTVFILLGLTQKFAIPGLPRYDALLLGCLLMQAFMLASRMESLDELKVICVFHLLGLLMELHKVAIGSWSYPGEAYTKVGGVPLFSGFMYAGVASYMCQCWRRLDLRLERYPSAAWTAPLGIAIYLNFFTNRWLPDIRWFLIPAVFVIFFRSRVLFTVDRVRFHMPLAVSFVLIAFFVWVAENIGTLLGAWVYPHQRQGWNLVHTRLMTSWFLLVIVSGMMVAALKHLKEGLRATPPAGPSAGVPPPTV